MEMAEHKIGVHELWCSNRGPSAKHMNAEQCQDKDFQATNTQQKQTFKNDRRGELRYIACGLFALIAVVHRREEPETFTAL
jgi:hypothetical protein